MTRPRVITVAYWALAVFFLLGLVGATVSALADNYPSHWRFIIWWAALAGAHLARLPLVPVIWCAFLFDAFDTIMLWMYAAQGGLFPFLIFPLLILPLTIYLWVRGQYSFTYFSKGAQNG